MAAIQRRRSKSMGSRPGAHKFKSSRLETFCNSLRRRSTLAGLEAGTVAGGDAFGSRLGADALFEAVGTLLGVGGSFGGRHFVARDSNNFLATSSSSLRGGRLEVCGRLEVWRLQSIEVCGVDVSKKLGSSRKIAFNACSAVTVGRLVRFVRPVGLPRSRFMLQPGSSGGELFCNKARALAVCATST